LGGPRYRKKGNPEKKTREVGGGKKHMEKGYFLGSPPVASRRVGGGP